MKKNPIAKFAIIILVFIGLAALVRFGATGFSRADDVVSSKNTILQLNLEGVILNGKKFIKHLKKYRDEEKVKAILININSPGGAVGPSQEIAAQIERVKTQFHKPIVCYSNGLMASGAYYAASSCDKIIVSSGALVGSIGVIMEFANLEKLYDWAKIKRFSITSGKFKDSGNEFREMRSDERALFQDMITETYKQFRKAVQDGRNLDNKILDQYADGRVFTGAKAVELGFADQLGDFDDAVKATAELAGIGNDYKLFEIPKPKRSLFDLNPEEDDEMNSVNDLSTLVRGKSADSMKSVIKYLLRTELTNQPLYMLPGAWN